MCYWYLKKKKSTLHLFPCCSLYLLVPQWPRWGAQWGLGGWCLLRSGLNGASQSKCQMSPRAKSSPGSPGEPARSLTAELCLLLPRWNTIASKCGGEGDSCWNTWVGRVRELGENEQKAWGVAAAELLWHGHPLLKKQLQGNLRVNVGKGRQRTAVAWGNLIYRNLLYSGGWKSNRGYWSCGSSAIHHITAGCKFDLKPKTVLAEAER